MNWFIRKYAFSSENSLKEMGASKKNYQCMSEKGNVKVEDYKSFCEFLKENMNDYLSHVDSYNNSIFYDIW